MRGLVIAALLGGCGYFEGDDRGGAVDPAPDARDPVVVPDGVWEPVPGAAIVNADLAADRDTVWWGVLRSDVPGVLLAATSPTGTSIVAPTLVAPKTKSTYLVELAVTQRAIVTMTGGEGIVLRHHDRTGNALGDARALVIENDGKTLGDFGASELISTADGGVQFVTALDHGDGAEIALVEVDPNGTQTSTVFLGTPDVYEGTPSNVAGFGAAARDDGSTLVAWGRAHVSCEPVSPYATLATSVTRTTVGAIRPVGDPSERGAMQPSIAASDDTAYIIWRIEDFSRFRVALARFPDVSTPLAEVIDTDGHSSGAVLTLAGPGRGAIAYDGGQRGGSRHVIAFTENAGIVQRSETRTIPLVDPDASSSKWVGLVHVGDDRYVLGWIEYQNGVPRLYATEIDFAGAVMRPAPAYEPRGTPPVRTHAPPCV